MVNTRFGKNGEPTEGKLDDNHTLDGLSTHNTGPIDTIDKLNGKRPQVGNGIFLRKKLEISTFLYIYSFSIL